MDRSSKPVPVLRSFPGSFWALLFPQAFLHGQCINSIFSALQIPGGLRKLGIFKRICQEVIDTDKFYSGPLKPSIILTVGRRQRGQTGETDFPQIHHKGARYNPQEKEIQLDVRKEKCTLRVTEQRKRNRYFRNLYNEVKPLICGFKAGVWRLDQPSSTPSWIAICTA